MIELQLGPHEAGELELFLHGAWAPQTEWSIPVSTRFDRGEQVLLRDPNNVRLAVFTSMGGGRGTLEVIERPRHADFTALRLTTAEVRERLAARGARRVRSIITDGFLTAETERLLTGGGADVAIIHIVEAGPVDHFARVRAAQTVANERVWLNILPVMPRDPAVVLRNYGATEIVEAAGSSYSPAVAELMDLFIPPRRKQGFCVWFTGLPSAGKSTIADQLSILLRERGRLVTLLDGDVVRMHLSKGLGFTREDRDTNIRRIGWVASEVVRHHGAVICAAVSPYQAARDDARRMVGGDRFVLVYVATPQEVCEERDVKGFYAKARAGGMTGFTGVDDPYEVPANAEIVLATDRVTPEENAHKVLDWLIRDGRIDGA